MPEPMTEPTTESATEPGSAPAPALPPPAPLSPETLAHLARRAGLPLPSDRLAGVTATVNAIDAVVGALRHVPLGEIPPAPSFTAAPSRKSS
ncbi:hypothetical protein [Streptomyces sp. NPDC059788]|uniref:hypothetical protein n=1 Tax=Streptomyces sp. NPDC059788 TaxID=3346948 RepID=UPI0036662224